MILGEVKKHKWKCRFSHALLESFTGVKTPMVLSFSLSSPSLESLSHCLSTKPVKADDAILELVSALRSSLKEAFPHQCHSRLACGGSLVIIK